MKFWKTFLFCLLFNQLHIVDMHAQSALDAKAYQETHHPAGSSMFAAVDPTVPYDIVTQSFPTFIPLSANRNGGGKTGNIELTSGGLKILEKGTYYVKFSVFLVNNDSIGPTPYVPVYLATNDVIDLLNPTNIHSPKIFSFGPIPYGFPVQFQGSGIVTVSKHDTTFTLFATNTSSNPVPITVGEWTIDAYRINHLYE